MEKLQEFKYKNDYTEFFLNNLPEWDDLDTIAHIIETNFKLKRLAEIEGFDTRKITYEFEGNELWLNHDGIVGNYFASPKDINLDNVREFAKKVYELSK